MYTHIIYGMGLFNRTVLWNWKEKKFEQKSAQHSGNMGQNFANWKNYENTTSQANWGMW